MIDYAQHFIRVNQLMQETQKELLKNNFYEAYEIALQAMVEQKLFTNAVKSMIRENEIG